MKKSQFYFLGRTVIIQGSLDDLASEKNCVVLWDAAYSQN